MSSQVFISYSRRDAVLVRPVVQLLRATKDFVFQDADSLKPGRQWRPQINQALEGANLVVLFWCLHSRDSEEVTSEYTSAIRANRDILPLLLDDTPLPPPLDEYQWVDFRHVAGPVHRALVAEPPRVEAAPPTRPCPAAMRPAPVAKRMSAPAGVVAVLLLILLVTGALLSYLTLSQPPHAAPSGVDSLPPPVDTLPPPAAPQSNVGLIATLVLAGFVVLVLAVLGVRRSRRASAHPAERIASELLGLVTDRLKGLDNQQATP